MTELSKELFQNALYDLGHGDFSSAKIWFIGIDDGEVLEPDELIDLYPEGTLYQPGQAEESQTTSVISKITTSLLKQENPQSWKDYRKSRLFTEGSEVFLTFMFPIGRGRQEDWFPEYETICGFSSNDYYNYVLKERPGRLGFLQNYIKDGNCQLLIFFGMGELTKTYWKTFTKFFDLESSTFIGIGDFVRLYSKERIIMLPHLSNYSIRKPLLDKILLLINENNLNPFIENNK